MMTTKRLLAPLVIVLAGLMAAGSSAQTVDNTPCPGPSGVRGGALTGTWTVAGGFAQVSGKPMIGGTNKVVLQSTGDGLSVQIGAESFSVNKVKDDVKEWTWKKSDGVSVTHSDLSVFSLCRNDQMTRFEGNAAMAGQNVNWRIMARTEREAYILWSFAGPPAAQGLFRIVK